MKDYNAYQYAYDMINFYNTASNPYNSYDNTDNADTCDIDRALVNQLKKSIMRLFNTYGTLVYNENENTVYKVIEGFEATDHSSVYRYYPNGMVYSVDIHGKNKVEENERKNFTLCRSGCSYSPATFLDTYTIPSKMQKLIDNNKDKVIEDQKNKAIKEKQRKIKKTIRKSPSKQINDPYGNIKKFLYFNKTSGFFDDHNNGYNDFIKFQAKKWYGKEINLSMSNKSVFFTKLFPPNMYKIYEALSKVNDFYNIRVRKNEMINTFYYKDPIYDKYGCKLQGEKWNKLGFTDSSWEFFYNDYFLNTDYWSVIKSIDDIIEKTCNYEIFEKMFYPTDSNGNFERYLYNSNRLRHRHDVSFINDNVENKEATIKDLILPDHILKPVPLFLGAKNKEHFENMVNDYCSNSHPYSFIKGLLRDNSAIKLNGIKMTSYLIAYSDKLKEEDRYNRYQYKYLRVNNYIPNPILYFFCAAYKDFVEQVKACEFGEEWLKFRGFIAPDPPAEKKVSKKTKTKAKKEAKK